MSENNAGDEISTNEELVGPNKGTVEQVSLNSVIQKRRVGTRAEIVLITYKVKDEDLQLAVQTLSGLSVVNKVSTVIRVVGADAE